MLRFVCHHNIYTQFLGIAIDRTINMKQHKLIEFLPFKTTVIASVQTVSFFSHLVPCSLYAWAVNLCIFFIIFMLYFYIF